MTRRPFPIWRSLGVAVLGHVVPFIGLILFEIVLMILDGFGVLRNDKLVDAYFFGNPGAVGSNILAILAETAMAVTTLIFLPRLSGKSFRELGFVAPTVRGVGFALLLCVAVIGVKYAYHFVLDATHNSHHRQFGFEHVHVNGTLAIVLFYLSTCLAAPICEEIYYRAFIFNGFAARMPLVLAYILNGIVFASVHGDLVYFPLLATLGIANAIAYRKTGSIVNAMLVHAMNNALATTAMVAHALRH